MEGCPLSTTGGIFFVGMWTIQAGGISRFVEPFFEAANPFVLRCRIVNSWFFSQTIWNQFLSGLSSVAKFVSQGDSFPDWSGSGGHTVQTGAYLRHIQPIGLFVPPIGGNSASTLCCGLVRLVYGSKGQTPKPKNNDNLWPDNDGSGQWGGGTIIPQGGSPVIISPVQLLQSGWIAFAYSDWRYGNNGQYKRFFAEEGFKSMPWKRRSQSACNIVDFIYPERDIDPPYHEASKGASFESTWGDILSTGDASNIAADEDANMFEIDPLYHKHPSVYEPEGAFLRKKYTDWNHSEGLYTFEIKGGALPSSKGAWTEAGTTVSVVPEPVLTAIGGSGYVPIKTISSVLRSSAFFCGGMFPVVESKRRRKNDKS